eukprot:TRINITY_DN13996_c0_g1_i1.p1 TRINITY_DN13996_c0_g1~~TRINITY_DN13996_c0_g1_i1.p1  ORF type:complete len:374 (+),score=58.66 TRINITY_DN13996_c0_g1_i1:98-1219(+)
MLKWCDIRSARHLNTLFKTQANDNLDGTLHRRRVLKMTNSLFNEVDYLREHRCVLGCRTLNTAISLLCRWGRISEAESLLQSIDQPDNRTYEILIKGYSKLKLGASESKILSLLAEHRKRGFPATAISYNALLACVAKRPEVAQNKTDNQKSLHQDAIKVLEQMSAAGVAPNIETVRKSLLCCPSLRVGEMVFGQNFVNVVDRKQILPTLAILSARGGDCETTLKLLKEYQQERPLTIINYNILLHSKTVSADIEGSLSLLRQLKSEHLTPTDVTFVTILQCCINCVSRKPGLHSHSFLEGTAEALLDEAHASQKLNNSLINNLMHLYGVTGNAAKADDLLTIAKREGYPARKACIEYHQMAHDNSRYRMKAV